MIQQKIELENGIRLVIVSDLHIGLRGFREDIFNDIIEDIKKPNTYWIGLGDFIEGREPSHKFYDPNEVVMSVGEQYEYFFDKVRPYVSTCIGLHPGNHEDSLILKSTINPILQFCNDNKITYLGAVARTVFDCNNNRISMVTAHGAGGGSKVGGSLNRIIDYAKAFNADIVAMGHFHKLCHTEELKSFEDEEDMIHWRPMTVILNGSALESYPDNGVGNYAERKLMQPSALGYTILNIDRNLNKTVELKSY